MSETEERTGYAERQGEVKEGIGTPIDLNTVLFSYRGIWHWINNANEVLFRLIDALQNEGASEVGMPALIPDKAEVLPNGDLCLFALPLDTPHYNLKYSSIILKEDWRLKDETLLITRARLKDLEEIESMYKGLRK